MYSCVCWLVCVSVRTLKARNIDAKSFDCGGLVRSFIILPD